MLLGWWREERDDGEARGEAPEVMIEVVTIDDSDDDKGEELK